jgi:eukaryotic-like serine/threonine-protein kinase
MEPELKVWDTQTSQNVANLSGHQGDIYSVKASYDGSFAVSVGVDKCVKLWDVRSKSLVGGIDGSHLSEMYEICLCSNQSPGP